MVPFATDAKHTADLGVPTYGFSPLRLDPDERFLERFHGVDERVSRRRPALGPAGPLRRRPALLRLTPRRHAASGAARGQSGALRSRCSTTTFSSQVVQT